MEGQNFSVSSDWVLGGESADSPAAELGPPTLRTHTDLGDLELAAEKALDLLRDEDADVVEGSGGLDGGSGGDASSGGSKSAGQSRGSGSGDGAEKVSPASDVPTEQAGGSGARVSARSTGVPPQGESSGVAVRLRTESSTESSNPAALPVGGLRAPGRGARGHASGNQQQEQVERQATAGSSKAATEGNVKAKAKAKSSKVAAEAEGSGNVSPTTSKVYRASPSPDSAAAPPPSDEDSGGASQRRHSTSFVAVAAKAVSPAVCRIDMERTVGTHGTPFGDVVTGQGSGLIFSSDDGLVLTNAHVVAGARKVCSQECRPGQVHAYRLGCFAYCTLWVSTARNFLVVHSKHLGPRSQGSKDLMQLVWPAVFFKGGDRFEGASRQQQHGFGFNCLWRTDRSRMVADLMLDRVGCLHPPCPSLVGFHSTAHTPRAARSPRQQQRSRRRSRKENGFAVNPTILQLPPSCCFSAAPQVTCTLTDGRKFLAEVKGSDTLSDLAVLQIDRDIGSDQTPLPEVTLGDSQDLQVTGGTAMIWAGRGGGGGFIRWERVHTRSFVALLLSTGRWCTAHLRRRQ